MQAIKSNNHNSGYSTNTLGIGHEYGTIADKMNVIKLNSMA
jgi:hypothetical protein